MQKIYEITNSCGIKLTPSFQNDLKNKQNEYPNDENQVILFFCKSNFKSIIEETGLSKYVSLKINVHTKICNLVNPILIQFNSIVDIGKPLYKMDKNCFEGEMDEEIFSFLNPEEPAIKEEKPILNMYEVTDGKILFLALQMDKCNELLNPFHVGMKLVILPPIIIRRSVLLLFNQKIRKLV